MSHLRCRDALAGRWPQLRERSPSIPCPARTARPRPHSSRFSAAVLRRLIAPISATWNTLRSNVSIPLELSPSGPPESKSWKDAKAFSMASCSFFSGHMSWERISSSLIRIACSRISRPESELSHWSIADSLIPLICGMAARRTLLHWDTSGVSSWMSAVNSRSSRSVFSSARICRSCSRSASAWMRAWPCVSRTLSRATMPLISAPTAVEVRICHRGDTG